MVWNSPFQSSVLPQEGGKVEKGGSIFSLITYPITFIHVSNWANSQWAKILWWFFVWFYKNTVDNLKKVVFWPVWYHLFKNRSSEFVLTMLIRFLIQLRTIIVDYIFYSCHQKNYTCIKIMLKIWFSKFWRVMSAKKVKLKIWYTTKPAQKKPLVIVLLLFYDELSH